MTSSSVAVAAVILAVILAVVTLLTFEVSYKFNRVWTRLIKAVRLKVQHNWRDYGLGIYGFGHISIKTNPYRVIRSGNPIKHMMKYHIKQSATSNTYSRSRIFLVSAKTTPHSRYHLGIGGGCRGCDVHNSWLLHYLFVLTL